MSVADILGVVGIVVGVAGVLVGIAYGRSRGRPVFKQTGNVVVAASPEEHITVQHSGKEVPRVARTRIALWNAGHKTLERSSIAAEYPIQFRFKGDGTQILSLQTVQKSDEANKVSATIAPDNSSIQVTFDYLDYRQGGLIEVLHTSDRWGAIASGKIKGLPRGIREVKSHDWGVPLGFIAAQVAFFTGTYFYGKTHTWYLQVSIIATGVLFVALALAIYVTINRRIFTEPKALSLSGK